MRASLLKKKPAFTLIRPQSGRKGKNRNGFTLIELLTVIALSSILGGIVTDTIVRSYYQNQQLQAASLAQKDLNLAIDRFDRVLRSTTLLLEVNKTNVKLRGYASASDTAPSEINIYLNGTKVSYSVIAPTGTAPNYTYDQANAQVYTLLYQVSNTAAQPLFYYYDDTNTQLTFPVNLSDVRVVEFAPLAKDSQNILKQPISITTRATLRNFKTNL